MCCTPRARVREAHSGRRGGCAKQRARFATNTHTPPAAHAADEDVNNATRRHADTQTATMHSKLLLASTFGAAAAFQAPAASKATSSLQAMYNPSSFDDAHPKNQEFLKILRKKTNNKMIKTSRFFLRIEKTGSTT